MIGLNPNYSSLFTALGTESLPFEGSANSCLKMNTSYYDDSKPPVVACDELQTFSDGHRITDLRHFEGLPLETSEISILMIAKSFD